MEYLVLFDKNGKKVSGKVDGINYTNDSERQALLDAGYVVVEPHDFDLYCNQIGGENGTGYVRDQVSGKPVSAPAYVPSKEDISTMLYYECQRDLEEIDAQIINAIVIKDNELIEELRQERDDRIAEYEAALDELEEGEGNGSR